MTLSAAADVAATILVELERQGGDPEVRRRTLSYAEPVRIANADPCTTRTSGA